MYGTGTCHIRIKNLKTFNPATNYVYCLYWNQSNIDKIRKQNKNVSTLNLKYQLNT